MRTHTLAGVAATALLLGAFAAGGVSTAGDRGVAKEASASAAKATRLLGKGDGTRAVAFAERAASLAPRDAGYRMVLGQSYLKAGRFASAGQAFADVLALTGPDGPNGGKAALNLALAQIAQGQWEVARTTLADHAARIPARDRGLALALAGDPAGGVEVLMTAARHPQADARTRQNLGLALALAGRWQDARTMVSGDLSAAEANARIMSWIEFARPRAASDQVAKLLGVTAVADAGQPAALALVDAAPPSAAETPVAVAVEAAEPVAAPDASPLVRVAQAAPAVGLPQVGAAGAPTPLIVFAERREVVQTLPAGDAPLLAAARPGRVPLIAAHGAFKSRIAARAAQRAPNAGRWFVQLGAYNNAWVARDAWKRATRRYAALGAHVPAASSAKGRTRTFYRLSVGGFARADAASLCRGLKLQGRDCFVRAGSGDRMAAWFRPTRIQTAARLRWPGIETPAR